MARVLCGSGSKRYKAAGEEGEGRRFKFVSFTLFVMYVVNCLVAGLVLRVWYPSKHTSKERATASGVALHALTALTQTLSMFCGNRSIYYVDYPTHVVAKCCKPIPVLLFGLLFGRTKNYPLSRVVAVSVTTVGVALFMHGSATSSGRGNSAVGFGLLAASLLLDGLTGLVQDTAVRKMKLTADADEARRVPWVMMMYLNAFGSLLLLLAMGVTGEGVAALRFIAEFPEALGVVLCAAVANAVGQGFIFVTIARFDALMCSTVTTVRKFCTILLSVLWFKHPLTHVQWASVALVFGGIGYELVNKSRTQKQQQQQQPKTPKQKTT